jgi:ADP-ribose pyrophosphatase YjhB (NUDIX family)
MDPQWLIWARQLQALAQDGLAYTPTEYDRERFEQIRDLAAEMLERQAGEPQALWLDLFKKQEGYATPKIDCRAVLIEEGRVLLVRERVDGLWTLPGGWCDPWSSLSENTEREVLEETGYTARAEKLLALYDRARHPHPPFPFHTYKAFLLCRRLGGEPRTSYEITEIGWFARGALPELSLPRVLPQQIERMFEHAAHPEWLADFD